MKTGKHPMRTRLRLFLDCGITFDEVYEVPERSNRKVVYANREALTANLPIQIKEEIIDDENTADVSPRGGISHNQVTERCSERRSKRKTYMDSYGEGAKQ